MGLSRRRNHVTLWALLHVRVNAKASEWRSRRFVPIILVGVVLYISFGTFALELV